MQVMTMDEVQMVSGAMSENQCIGGSTLIGAGIGTVIGAYAGLGFGAGFGFGAGATIGGSTGMLFCRYFSE